MAAASISSPEEAADAVLAAGVTRKDQASLSAALLAARSAVAAAGADRCDAACARMRAGQDALGWIYLLDAAGGAGDLSGARAQVFLERTSAALTSAALTPEAARLCPEALSSLCRRFTAAAVAASAPAAALPAVLASLRAARPAPDTLTPQHACALQLCLCARLYSQGAPLVEEPIFEVNVAATGLTARDFLLYCYYGGMVAAGLKRFDAAIELFGHAITAPAQALSAITLAAYRKHALCSLIAHGSVPPLPKWAPMVAVRSLKSNSSDYHDIAQAYAAGKLPALAECVESKRAALEAEGNWGLAQQAVSSLRTRLIQRLTQTYLTLSLEEIASIVGLGSAAEAEAALVATIEAGEIHARVSHRAGMVSFLEDPEQYDTRAASLRLDERIRRVGALQQRLQAADAAVACDRAYAQKLAQRERHGRWGGGGDGAEDVGF